MKKVLTIAGSDSSGGAGIQADIKTITMNGDYAMSVITALTAQNTTGVYGVLDIAPSFVKAQLDAVFTDIIPDAVKIGMVSNSEIIKTIVKTLKEYNAKNIVADPVMVSTSEYRLLSKDAEETLINELLPIASLITPNIPEAEILYKKEIKTKEDMETAAKFIYEKTKTAVLVKGGHLVNDAMDFLYDGKEGTWFLEERIENENTHGTGCTLSSAIASNLAKGYDLKTSIKNAKTYLTGALKANLDIGKGKGPLKHNYNL